jgi:MFS family permease
MGGVRRGRVGRAVDLARNLAVSTLLAAGFFRFFFKFAYLTYVPVLAVSSGAMSVWQVGLLLGAAAASAAVSAPLAGRITACVRLSTVIGGTVCSIGASFLLVSAEFGPVALWASAVAFGFADGVFGVVQTALTTQIPGDEIRATFVGLAATLRNLGKFAAPTMVGGLVVWLTVARSFAVVGAVALLAVGMVVPLRSLEGDAPDAVGVSV